MSKTPEVELCLPRAHALTYTQRDRDELGGIGGRAAMTPVREH